MEETVAYLHTDQLGSIRAITDAAGEAEKQSLYKPFGEEIEFIRTPAHTAETKGFYPLSGHCCAIPCRATGERYDDSGLQLLNARYYDPKLAMFTQPDWFEVTQPGVGTNRYSYSFNDPVNLSDPNGNFVPLAVWGAVAAYKAVSAAIAVHDAYQTVQGVADGSVSVGEAAAGVAGDVVIGATVGKGLAKVVEKVGGAVKSTVKDFVADESGAAKVPGRGAGPKGGFGPMRRRVDHPDLNSILDSNFEVKAVKGGRVGNGGTADALRYEDATGDLLSPEGHRQKATEIRKRLDTFVRRATNSPNPNSGGSTYSSRDIEYANELIKDLDDALGN